MITIERPFTQSGFPGSVPTRTVHTQEALSVLVLAELGFSCQVLVHEECRIVVRTRVFATVDLVTFTGNKEEMSSLFKVVKYYLALGECSKEKENPLTSPAWLELAGSHNLLPKDYIGIVVTGRRVVNAVLLAYKLSEEERAIARSIKLDELLVYCELKEETGQPFLEVVAALAA